MKKIILITIASIMLSACGPAHYENANDRYTSLPPELSGCKVYDVYSNDGGYFKAVTCKSKDTMNVAFTSGKTMQSVAIVTDSKDGNAFFIDNGQILKISCQSVDDSLICHKNK